MGANRRRPSGALGARLLSWVLLIAAAGCSTARKDQSTGAVAERWALAIRNADARSYMSEIAPEAFQYRARLVSSDPGWFVLGRSEEEAVVSAFFRTVRYVSGTARVESTVGNDAVVSIGLELVDAYQKGGRDQLRYRIDAKLRVSTAILGGERRIVSVDEEPTRASARHSLVSFALVKLLQSDLVDVQEREERPREDTVVLIESLVERSRGTKLIEVRYTTVSGRGVDAATPVKAFAEVVDSRGQRVDNVEALDWERSKRPDGE